jgi:ribonuclease R
VHISELGSDYFHFDESRHELVGEHTHVRYRLSDRVEVQLARADLETSKIDFRLLDGTARPTLREGKTVRERERKTENANDPRESASGNNAPSPRKTKGKGKHRGE